MSPAEIASIRPLLDKIGMPYTYAPRRVETWFGWNGKSLNLAYPRKGGTCEVVHEVAHWLIAPPEWRPHEGFGLDHTRNASARKAYFGGKSPDDEEMCASLLGILIERHLAFDWRSTWSFHSWDQNDWRPGRAWDVRLFIRDLQRGGFLRGLTPTCFL